MSMISFLPWYFFVMIIASASSAMRSDREEKDTYKSTSAFAPSGVCCCQSAPGRILRRVAGLAFNQQFNLISLPARPGTDHRDLHRSPLALIGVNSPQKHQQSQPRILPTTNKRGAAPSRMRPLISAIFARHSERSEEPLYLFLSKGSVATECLQIVSAFSSTANS